MSPCKFIITNLGLINPQLQHNCLLRIKNSTNNKNSQYFDSPVIQAQTCQFQGQFPWTFIMDFQQKIEVIIEWIEIHEENGESKDIIQGYSRVDMVYMYNVLQRVTICSKRSRNKICVLQCCFSECQQKLESQRNISNKSRKPNKKKNNHFEPEQSYIQPEKSNRKYHKSNKNNKPNKTNNKVSKQNKKQEQTVNKNKNIIAKEISNLNKSIEQLLNQSKEQHEEFSKYLNQSTQFLKELKKNNENKKQQNQNKQESREQQQQGENDINKSEEVNNNKLQEVSQQHLAYGEQDYSKIQPMPNTSNQQFKYFEQESFPQIDQQWYQNKFNKPFQPHKYAKNYNSKQPKHPIQTSLDYSKSQFDFQLQQQNVKLSDIILNTDIKPQQLSLSIINNKFDQKQDKDKFNENQQNKNMNRILTLKCLQDNQYSYQWKRQIIVPENKYIQVNVKDLSNKDDELFGCFKTETSRNKNKTLDKMGLFDRNGENRGTMSFQIKKIQTCEVQTPLMWLQEGNDLVKGIQENDQERNIEKKQIQINLPQSKCNNQSIKSQFNKFNQRQQQEEQKLNNYQRMNNQKLQERPQFRSSSRKKKSLYNINPQSQSSFSYKNKTQQNSLYHHAQSEFQMSERGFPEYIKKKFHLVSNQISVNLAPVNIESQIERIQQEHARRKQQIYDSRNIQESRVSHFTSNESSSKNVSIKINSISAKLNKNINSFSGTFLRIRVNNRKEYTTQTLGLSKNLNWKGKGYIFQNIPPFSQIEIQVFTYNNLSKVWKGTAKLCLALMSLDQLNKNCFSHEYIRDQKINPIGQLILGYQAIHNKNKRTMSSSPQIQSQRYYQIQEPYISSLPKKKKNKKVSSSRNLLTDKKKKKKIEFEQSKIRNLLPIQNSIRKRKYTGGNIIIGRAPRNQPKMYTHTDI